MSVTNDQQSADPTGNVGNDVSGQQAEQTGNVEQGTDTAQGTDQGVTSSHDPGIGSLVTKLDGEVITKVIDGVEHAVEQVGQVIGEHPEVGKIVGWFEHVSIEAAEKLKSVEK